MRKLVIRTGKNGSKQRTIYIPDSEQRKHLREIKNELDWIYLKLGVPDCVHGLWYNRSPATNAMAHVGKRFTLCVDLKDFFESINYTHLGRRLPQNILRRVLVNKQVPQGFCTSPILTNIAMLDADRILKKFSTEQGVIYTRYADDITLSGDDDKAIGTCKTFLMEALKVRKLYLNHRKTTFQDGLHRRRIITGYSVGDDVRARYVHRRKLRAAEHQGNKKSEGSLRGWCNPYRVRHAGITVEPVVGNLGQRYFKASNEAGVEATSFSYRSAIRKLEETCIQMFIAQSGGSLF